MKTLQPNGSILYFFRNTLFFIFFTFASSNLTAQITINQDIISDNIGKTVTTISYETDLGIHFQLEELLSAEGPNQNYNFKTLAYIDSTEVVEQYMTVPDDDPFIDDPNLANSNVIVKTTFTDDITEETFVQYRYNTLENNDWTTNGAISMVDIDDDGMLDTLVQWFSPPSRQIAFPVTYGSSWNDSTSLHQIFMGMEFVSNISLDSTTVPGYGSLMTPYGMADALRVHNKVVSFLPGTMFSTTVNAVNFVTENDMISATILIEDGRAFHTVRNVEGGTSTFDIPKLSFHLSQNYPNPIRDRTTIEFNLLKRQNVDLVIIDLDGKLVSRIHQGECPQGLNQIDWRPVGLSPGSYILQMKVENQIQHRIIALSN